MSGGRLTAMNTDTIILLVVALASLAALAETLRGPSATGRPRRARPAPTSQTASSRRPPRGRHEPAHPARPQRRRRPARMTRAGRRAPWSEDSPGPCQPRAPPPGPITGEGSNGRGGSRAGIAAGGLRVGVPLGLPVGAPHDVPDSARPGAGRGGHPGRVPPVVRAVARIASRREPRGMGHAGWPSEPRSAPPSAPGCGALPRPTTARPGGTTCPTSTWPGPLRPSPRSSGLRWRSTTSTTCRSRRSHATSASRRRTVKQHLFRARSRLATLLSEPVEVTHDVDR